MSNTHISNLPEEVRNRRMARLLLIILLAFFAAIVVANFFLVTLANQSWNGLITDHAYEKGIAYNQTLAKRAEENALGWHINVSNTNEALSVNLTDKQGTPLSHATITATLKRPTHEGYDQTISLPHTTGGLYQAPVSFPLKGIWDVNLTIQSQDGTIETTQRIVVK